MKDLNEKSWIYKINCFFNTVLILTGYSVSKEGGMKS